MENELSPQEQEIYMQQLIENYQNPKNFGNLEDYTYYSHQKNTTCGDSFDIYIKTNKEKKIEDIKFYGEGCAISTASFSLLTQKLKGIKIEDAKKFSKDELKKMIGVKISPGRTNCAMLSYNALHDAINPENNNN